MIASESGKQLMIDASSQTVLRLIPAHSQGGVQDITLNEGQYLIGSGDNCHVQLSCAGVAEAHCEVHFMGSQVTVKPIDPRTWVNDAPARRRKLRQNDRLTIGPVNFTVAFVEESKNPDAVPGRLEPTVDSNMDSTSDPVVSSNESNSVGVVASSHQEQTHEDLIEERLEQIDQHAANLEMACETALEEPKADTNDSREEEEKIVAQRKLELDQLEESLKQQLKEISESREVIHEDVQSIHVQKEELKELEESLRVRLKSVETQQEEIQSRSEEIASLKTEVEQTRKQFEDEKQSIEAERNQLAELKAELERERKEWEQSRIAVEPPQIDPQSIAVPDAVRVETFGAVDNASQDESDALASDEQTEDAEVFHVEADTNNLLETEDDVTRIKNTLDPVSEGNNEDAFDELDAIGDSISGLLNSHEVRETNNAEPSTPAKVENVVEKSEDDSDQGEVTELRSQLADMFGIPAQKPEQSEKCSSKTDPNGHEAEETTSEETSTGLSSERFLNLDSQQETSIEPATPASKEQETVDPVEEQARTESASDSELEEEDDSVAAYMKQLLARSNRNQQPEPETSGPKRRRSENYERPSAVANENSQANESQNSSPEVISETAKPKREKPDVDKDAVRRDMDSFRELANMSARSAVAKHSSKKIRIKLLLNLVLAVVSFGLSMVLFVTSLVTDKAYFTYAILSALVGVMTGFELLRSSVLAKRSRVVKKPTQEALAEVQSELDSYEESEE